jgi:hypothetical protein
MTQPDEIARIKKELLGDAETEKRKELVDFLLKDSEVVKGKDGQSHVRVGVPRPIWQVVCFFVLGGIVLAAFFFATRQLLRFIYS